jgi:predicted HD phosphohydrolase
MSPAEVERFESNPHYKDAVQLRLYDDDGKVAGLTIKPITDYRQTLESLLLN